MFVTYFSRVTETFEGSLTLQRSQITRANLRLSIVGELETRLSIRIQNQIPEDPRDNL